jgi:hypothetical protein
MFYSPATAIKALDDILAQLESDSLFDELQDGETVERVREALYALQAEEAYEEANTEPFENREGDPAFNGAFTSW